MSDDLKVLEVIGPKIKSALHKNVVTSYFDLVENSESDLINILN